MNTVTLQFRTSTLALLLAALVSIFILDTRSRNKARTLRHAAPTPQPAQPIKNFAPRNPWDKSAQGESVAPKHPPRTPSGERPSNPFAEKKTERRTSEQIIQDAINVGADVVRQGAAQS